MQSIENKDYQWHKPTMIDEKIIQDMDKKIANLNQPTAPTIIVAPVPTKNTLPTPDEFTLFYNDFTFFKTPLNFSIDNNTIVIKNQTPNAHNINIGIYPLISLLASKFDAPVSENMIDLKKGSSPLPDFDKIDTIIKQKSWDIQTMFVNIYQYSDARCISECYKYHELMAMPLELRIRFLEWEKSLVSQKVANGILDGLKERDAELEQIRKDYVSKHEKEKTLHRTEFDIFNRESQKFKIVMEQLNTRNDNLVQKLESVTTENSGYYEKVQEAESKAETANRELTNLKIKNAELEKKVAKYEVDPWMLDTNSNVERPVFYNKVSGDIISYPDNFKAYKLTVKEGDVMVYTNDKDKEFKVPEGLILHQQKKKAPDSLLVIDDKKEENTLTQRQNKIFNAILESDFPLAIVEISEITGIAPNHINEDKKTLLKNGLIKDVNENGINKYSPK